MKYTIHGDIAIILALDGKRIEIGYLYPLFLTGRYTLIKL